MKRFIALMMVGVMSAACLKAATEPTASFQAGGIEKVVHNMTARQVVNVATLAPFVTPQEAVPTARIIPVALSEVRPLAATKVVLHRATGIFNLKPAWLAVSKDTVRWKAVAHRSLAAKAGFSAASPPTAPLGPDKPASVTTQSTVRLAWHPPDDNDPVAIEEGRHAGLSNS